MVALDFGLDTTTPAGEMVANVILSTSQYERRMIGVRTRDALAQKREQGVLLGRPSALPAEVVALILAAYNEGQSKSAIARAPNDDGIPTSHGGVTWRQFSVRAVLVAQGALAR